MYKILAALAILLLTVLSGEAIEHSHKSRRIMCELGYIQGQVDTAKSLDIIITGLEKKSKNRLIVEFVRSIQKYQITIHQIDGSKNCVNIEPTFVEILFNVIKTQLKKGASK